MAHLGARVRLEYTRSGRFLREFWLSVSEFLRTLLEHHTFTCRQFTERDAQKI